MTGQTDREDAYLPSQQDGPSYLDFITPNEIFDKGPAAVQEWQEAKRAELQPNPVVRRNGIAALAAKQKAENDRIDREERDG